MHVLLIFAATLRRENSTEENIWVGREGETFENSKKSRARTSRTKGNCKGPTALGFTNKPEYGVGQCGALSKE